MIFGELFLVFLMIGAFTFGGGYAMLPLIQEAVVEKGWIDAEAVVDFIAVAESTPGPFAINMATYVGSEIGGQFGLWGSILGAVCTTLGVVIPSFIIILIVARCYDRFRKSTVVGGCMTGLKPAVVGLIAGAVVSVGATVFFPAGWDWTVFHQLSTYLALGITGLMLVLSFKKVHPVLIICSCAVLGIVFGYCGLLT